MKTAGTLWVGTRVGINYIDAGKQYFRYYGTELFSHTGITAINSDSNSTVLLGTPKGIMWFNYKDNELERYFEYHSIGDGLEDAVTNCIIKDSSGSIWIGTRYIGLIRLDLATSAYSHYYHIPQNSNGIPSDWINSLSASPDGKSIWIGIDEGLCRLEYEDGVFTQYRHDPQDPASLCNNGVCTVYTTKDGTLCIGELVE